MTNIKQLLQHEFERSLGWVVSTIDWQSVGGGSINETFRLRINGSQNWFLKLNSAYRYPGLFKAESKGLALLAGTGCIRVPVIRLSGEIESQQYLLMEWIDRGSPTKEFWKSFGKQLAALHSHSQVDFGLEEDNYMGSLPQNNQTCSGWIEFFVERRIKPQVRLAEQRGYIDANLKSSFELLYSRLPSMFDRDRPSLLHGDLWSGNFMCSATGDPVLIDPAVYFGHRSADLGMTTLFGGFDKSFYEAYHYHSPFPSNYRQQWNACNLYPLLVHVNLFGEGYLAGVRAVLEELGIRNKK